MKKTLNKILITTLLTISLISMIILSGCGNQTKKNSLKDSYVVGICQLIQHNALDQATKGFKDALSEQVTKAGKKIEFKEHNAQGEPTLCTIIADTLVKDNVDLIMANATGAVQAVYEATTSIPILGTSVTEYGVALGIDNFNGTIGANISGTSDLAPLESQAQMLIDLLPQAKKIGIVYCSGEPNSDYQAKEIRRILTSKGLTCVDYKFADSNDLASVVTSACINSDALYIPTDNVAASNAENIGHICLEYKTPVIAGEEGICKGCGIASLSISYYNLGRITGLMAARILLKDADISTMAIEYDTNPVYKYNKTICEQLNISIDTSKYVAIED